MPARSLLVCVDFSTCSRRALEEGSRLAADERAELHVLHVVESEVVEELAEATDAEPEPLGRQLLADAERHLREFCGAGCTGRLHVATGELLATVLEAAKSASADMIVLGLRGQADGDGAGSLATACVRRSPIPVLLVHEGHTGPFRSIVAGINFTDVSSRVVANALRVMHADRARLVIAHVFFPPWERVHYGSPTTAATPHFRRRYEDAVRDRLRGLVDELTEGSQAVQVETELVESNDRALGLLDCIKRQSADLAVVGSRGRSQWRDMLLGRTSDRLLRSADTSMLVVPPDEQD